MVLMLEKIIIANFRCLQVVKAPLRALTVLIGPNDSGKSAFLAALQYLSGARGLEKYDWWRADQQLELLVRGIAQGWDIQRSSRQGDRYSTGSVNPLQPTLLYQLPAAGVSMESEGYPDEGEPPTIGPNGELTPALLDYFLRGDRNRFFAVAEAMRSLIPGFQDITIRTPHPQRRRFDFIIDNGFSIPADRASVGVRLMIFFLALAYHPKPPAMLLLEEPETGVHPRRLADIVRLLRELGQGLYSKRPTQIVLTTHSPYLLDHINPEVDQVLAFRRNDDGSRICQPVDAERLKVFLDEFMLGEVWYNEGEEGLWARKS